MSAQSLCARYLVIWYVCLTFDLLDVLLDGGDAAGARHPVHAQEALLQLSEVARHRGKIVGVGGVAEDARGNRLDRLPPVGWEERF